MDNKNKDSNNIPIPSDEYIQKLSQTLLQQINTENTQLKYARVADVVKLVGAGLFVAGTLVFPTLPMVLKPFLKESSSDTSWKQFNIPYLKRILTRLEKEKIVEVSSENGKEEVKITQKGKLKIIRYAFDELSVEKPSIWNGKWYLVSYDFPKFTKQRNIFREYLKAWGFYPLHKSVYLHAYPCEKQVDFLREYLGIGRYVRIFKVDSIENDREFKEYFGVK